MGNPFRDWLANSLINFYSYENVMQILYIIQGKSKISLRILDWFVTNYSKKNNVSLLIKDKDDHFDYFDVHVNYRSQLKAYSKLYFDPFKRRQRIVFNSIKELEFETTIAQLNFFKWIIQNNILEYIEKNFEAIQLDMNMTQKDNKEKGVSRKKRDKFCKSKLHNINVFERQMTISFD